jgi:cell division protein FtsQ
MNSQAKKYGLLFLVVAAIGLTVFANVWKSHLKVSRVTLEGNRIVEANELFQLAHVKNGTLIYDIDLIGIQKNLLSHCYVKEAIVERNLPSTIQLTVVERKPIAMLNRAETIYLDEEGVILPHSLSKALFDLPVLTGIQIKASQPYGSVLDNQEVKEALVLLKTAKLVNNEMYHLISEIQVRNGNDMVLYAAEGGVPIIMGEGNVPDKLVRLEAFWKEVIHERGIQYLQYVDLRYSDQVVARWSDQSNKSKTL